MAKDTRTQQEKLHDKHGQYSPRDARQANRPTQTRQRGK